MSKIEVPILGEVSVLFVKVCVPVVVTSPITAEAIFGLVPSSAFAYAITVSPFATVILSPDPETYLNVID